MSDAIRYAPHRGGRRRWLERLSAANLALVVALAAARRLLGGWGEVGVVLTYPPQFPWLAPGLALGVVALVKRRRLALAWNAGALVVGLFGLMGFTWSLRTGGAGGAPRVRVMTYNVAGASRGVAQVVEDVMRQRPDIVALQEARPWGRYPHAAEALLTAWPDREERRSNDLAVVSRFPILSSRVVPLPSQQHQEFLEVRIATPGGPVTLITMHLSSRDLLRNPAGAEARAAAALIAAAPPPVIVLGDLNSPPQGPPYRWLRRCGVDAFAAAGRGFGYTFSAERPLVRIDHIFVGSGLRALRAWTPVTHGSDHRPVVAEIAVLPQGHRPGGKARRRPASNREAEP